MRGQEAHLQKHIFATNFQKMKKKKKKSTSLWRKVVLVSELAADIDFLQICAM